MRGYLFPDAQVMEAAEILHKLNLRPKRTLRVIAWMDEESGGAGSQTYTKDHLNEFARQRLPPLEMSFPFASSAAPLAESVAIVGVALARFWLPPDLLVIVYWNVSVPFPG